jgi:hypothetical protein
MEKQYQITLTERQHKSIVAILMAINSNRRFQTGSNLRESHVCNINEADIEAMDYVTDFDNWTESSEPTTVKIGSEIEINGKKYVCQKHAGYIPEKFNECEGCAFEHADLHSVCADLNCAAEDRRDKQDVIFIEKGGAA